MAETKKLAIDQLESSGKSREEALSLLQFLGLSDKATTAEWEKAAIQHGQNYQTPKIGPGGLSGFLEALPGAAARTAKDIGGYPGQALHAANTLVGDIPGANSLANWLQNNVYGPLGTGESAVAHALLGGMFPSGGGGGQPAATTTKKKDTGSHQVTEQVPTTFDLSAAVQQAAAPYTQALQAAASGGLPGGLNQYLANVPAGIANTIRSGLGNEQHAEQGLVGALQTQQANEGSAGLLTDLLNAARYQAIYKQGLYAPAPPANTELGQLYSKVTAGGNSLLGVPGSTLPGGTKSPTAPAGTKNPYATAPPKV